MSFQRLTAVVICYPGEHLYSPTGDNDRSAVVQARLGLRESVVEGIDGASTREHARFVFTQLAHRRKLWHRRF